MKICIQAGHINAKNNVLVSMRGNTGAPGEQELNKRIADRVSGLLRERSIEVYQTDACGNSDPKVTKVDYSLFVALHGDADAPNDQGGGMIGSGDKSVDASWQESKRIKDVMDGVYFKETQIVNKNYVTPGMAKYYMWQYLTPKTPCVLIEMGQVQDPHDRVLLANTTLIANAIVRSICKALNIPYELPKPTIDTKQVEIDDLKNSLKVANEALIKMKSEYESSLATANSNCLLAEGKLKRISEIIKL